MGRPKKSPISRLSCGLLRAYAPAAHRRCAPGISCAKDTFGVPRSREMGCAGITHDQASTPRPARAAGSAAKHDIRPLAAGLCQISSRPKEIISNQAKYFQQILRFRRDTKFHQARQFPPKASKNHRIPSISCFIIDIYALISTHNSPPLASIGHHMTHILAH